jgi:hypothetical protein
MIWLPLPPVHDPSKPQPTGLRLFWRHTYALVWFFGFFAVAIPLVLFAGVLDDLIFRINTGSWHRAPEWRGHVLDAEFYSTPLWQRYRHPRNTPASTPR